MKRVLQIFQLVFAILAFGGCSGQSDHAKLKRWMTQDGRVKVLCTIAMIEDLVAEVGGERVDTLTLVQGQLDPHTYQLVKGDDEKLAAADLIFYNGLGLEHGPSLRQYLEEADKAVGLGNKIRENNPDSILHYNGSIDPHIWMDIQMWEKTVPYIVETLAKFDPVNEAQYKLNGKKLTEKLKELHKKLRDEMHQIPVEKRYLVTSHDAFNYFARSYMATDEEIGSNSWQKRFAAPEGLAPESQLSTSDIRLILEHMKKYGIAVIFSESNVSQASIRKLDDAGEEQVVQIEIAPDPLYGDAMGAPGSPGDSYFKMLEHNVKTIVKYLSGNEKKSKQP